MVETENCLNPLLFSQFAGHVDFNTVIAYESQPCKKQPVLVALRWPLPPTLALLMQATCC